jgi:hypothetical protein
MFTPNVCENFLLAIFHNQDQPAARFISTETPSRQEQLHYIRFIPRNPNRGHGSLFESERKKPPETGGFQYVVRSKHS